MSHKHLFFLSFLFLTSCQPTVQSEFQWLLGTWERTDLKNNSTGYEIWTAEGNAFQGLGITLINEDTVFREILFLTKQDEAFFYSADVPENPDVVKFKIIEKGPTSFTAVNESHDFPNRIVYQLEKESLRVSIANMDNSTRRQFLFKKVTN